jgi:hypothetical protein
MRCPHPLLLLLLLHLLSSTLTGVEYLHQIPLIELNARSRKGSWTLFFFWNYLEGEAGGA